jgi:Lon protease-like protein
MSDEDPALELPGGVPETVPLFPLPGHVFLPSCPTPYRMFEPRYRALVRSLLELPEERRWLAVARLVPGHEEDYEGNPPFFRTATLGRLVECLPETDGTFHVVVGDGARCDLTEVPSGQPFRMVRPVAWPDLPDAPGDDTPGDFEALVQVVAALAQVLGRPAQALVAIVAERTRRTRVVYRLGNVLLRQADLRQQFLESRSLRERIGMVTTAAAALVAVAGGNGGSSPC